MFKRNHVSGTESYVPSSKDGGSWHCTYTKGKMHSFCTTAQLHSSHMLAWRGNGTQKALQFLPGNSHGQRSLVGCSPWGREESDTTEQLHFHFSLSCIREGNGNSFQCSCLENPRDSGAWWAAVYGVAQSWTQLKRLSSSSSSSSRVYIYIYTMEYYSVIKMSEIVPFAVTWT